MCKYCIFLLANQSKGAKKTKKKTNKGKKESEAGAPSQSHYNSPSTNGQVTTSTKGQNLAGNPEYDELEKTKKIKGIKKVRIFVQWTKIVGLNFDRSNVY